MLTQPTTKVLYGAMHPDVVVLAWPDQAGGRARLESAGVPRLWIVEPGIDPPVCESCIEDWLRLPADDADVRARIASLASRGARHLTRPTLDEHGQLTQRGAVIFLSPVEQCLVGALIASFGAPVSEHDLVSSAWPDEGHAQTLRVHVSRLRRRLAPLGLAIKTIRGYGYMLHAEV